MSAAEARQKTSDGGYPAAVLGPGDPILLVMEGRETRGVVRMASRNGRSLLVEFDALFGGYSGMMPLLHDGEGYRDLIRGVPVEVIPIPLHG